MKMICLPLLCLDLLCRVCSCLRVSELMYDICMYNKWYCKEYYRNQSKYTYSPFSPPSVTVSGSPASVSALMNAKFDAF